MNDLTLKKTVELSTEHTPKSNSLLQEWLKKEEDEFTTWPETLNIPQWIAYLAHSIYEGLEEHKARRFTRQFVKAAAEAQINQKAFRKGYCVHLLAHTVKIVNHLKIAELFKEEVTEAIQGILKLHEYNHTHSNGWENALHTIEEIEALARMRLWIREWPEDTTGKTWKYAENSAMAALAVARSLTWKRVSYWSDETESRATWWNVESIKSCTRSYYPGHQSRHIVTTKGWTAYEDHATALLDLLKNNHLALPKIWEAVTEEETDDE